VVLGAEFDEIYKVSILSGGFIYINNSSSFPSLSKNTNYKFDTSHGTNYTYSLLFESLTLNSTEQALIDSNISYYGVPGKNGSFVILNITSQFPSQITLRLSTDPVATREIINITN
jgi:hypothetical protein